MDLLKHKGNNKKMNVINYNNKFRYKEAEKLSKIIKIKEAEEQEKYQIQRYQKIKAKTDKLSSKHVTEKLSMKTRIENEYDILRRARMDAEEK